MVDADTKTPLKYLDYR